MRKVAIVGISGAVGTTLLELFERHETPETEMILFRSSAGSKRDYKGASLAVREFGPKAKAETKAEALEELRNCDVVFLCVSGGFSLEHARALASLSTSLETGPQPQSNGPRKSPIVIDNSSALRYCDDVPLIMPSINGQQWRGEQLIANPNCSTAIALMALAPLEQQIGIEYVQLATYQAASGAGAPAVAELREKTRAFSDYGADNESEYFHYNLAYNVVPHIDDFQENGYSKEEMKLAWELRKILQRPELPVVATCVRVPTLRSHAEAISVKLSREVDLQEIRELWRAMPGLKLLDRPEAKLYPMPSTSSMRYDVEVGRLRHNLIHGKSVLEFFVSGDQLLRGAALNAYEIYCLTQGLPLPQELP